MIYLDHHDATHRRRLAENPARVTSQINICKWKAAFTFWEKFIYVLFLLFAKFNLAGTHEREQVAATIEAAHFREYEIQKEGDEVKVKLTKRLDTKKQGVRPAHKY
jgi:hypothetical protein